VSQVRLIPRYSNTMRFFSKTVIAIFALSLTSCFELSLDGLITSNYSANSNTHLLEGGWHATTEDSFGTRYSTLEVLRSGVVLHWYDEFGSDLYDKYPDAVASVTVSSTYQVHFKSEFSYWDYAGVDTLIRVVTELDGNLVGDNISVYGQTTYFEDGVVVDTDGVYVFAERNDAGNGDGENDGANTALLEGAWSGAYTDALGVHDSLIEFNLEGELISWRNEYGEDLVTYFPDLEAFGLVSSENAVDFSAHYSYFLSGSEGIDYENRYEDFIDCSGVLSADNNSISMYGNATTYRNGEHYATTAISFDAARVQTASGSRQNWRAPWR
jgi:hypothetical protein